MIDKKAYNDSYYVKNKEYLKARSRERYKQKRDLILQDRAVNWEKYKSIELKSNFGITYNTYLGLLQKQNGACAICKLPETTKSRSGRIKLLAVDHCHKTGWVRGLLCAACNQAIGLIKEDVDTAVAIINYLESHAKVAIPTVGQALLSATTDGLFGSSQEENVSEM